MNVYQFSLPTVQTTGTIRIKDKTYEINCNSWFDRQWQVAEADIFIKWGWMDMNLDNGDYLSLWFTVENGKETAWATVLHPDGTHSVVYVEPMLQNADDIGQVIFQDSNIQLIGW